MDILKGFAAIAFFVFVCAALAKFIMWVINGGITISCTISKGMAISLDGNAKMPRKAHDDDAGYDLFATEDVYIKPHGKVTVDTGVHFAIPKGYFGDIRPKSGLLFNHDIIVGSGTVDCGYTGSVKVRIINLGDEPYEFHKGEKIAQMVLVPCLTRDLVVVDKLTETERGNGGFGSTGK